STTATFGPVPTKLDVRSWRMALRAGYRRKLAKGATLSTGIDFQGAHTEVSRFGSLNLPAREGDVTVFGEAPGTDGTADDWTTTIAGAAPYAFAELSFGRLSITPGLRIEPMVIDGSRLTPRTGSTPTIGFRRAEWAVDPRVQATLRATRRLSLRAGGGVYH